MIALPQSFEEYSSSEFSECESPMTGSEFSASSPMPNAPSPGEDTPTTSHPMVTRRKHQVQAARRQSSRLMSAPPQSYEESLSSELNEPESPSFQLKLSATSPMQDAPSPEEESLTAIHPMATRTKHQVQPTRRQSGYGSVVASHRATTRGKCLVQVTQPKSSPSEKPTPKKLSVRPRKQVTPHRERTPTPPRLSPSKQGTSAQQEFNALQTRIPTPQQFYAPQESISAKQQFLPNQQRPVISDLSAIDPSLVDLIFKEANTINQNLLLPPDPILLNIGKPIRISIWEFRNFHPFDSPHEEPSDLALSDYEEGTLPISEGGTDIPATSERTPVEKGEATKYPYKIRKPFERRRKPRNPHKARDPTRPRKLTSKHTPVKVRSPREVRSPIKEPTPIEDHEFNYEQTRFIIFMRAYWGMPYDDITEALNREFEGDNRGALWKTNQVARRLGAVKHDSKFEEYGKAWEDARVFRTMSRRA